MQVEMVLEPQERKPQISPRPHSHQPGEDIRPSIRPKQGQVSRKGGNSKGSGGGGPFPREPGDPLSIRSLHPGSGGPSLLPPPPKPHPDRRLEASQTQLLLPQNQPPGLQGRTRSRGPRKVNGTPPACCKSPVPSPSPQPRGRGSQDLTRSHPMGLWPRTSVTQTSSPGPPGSTAHPGQTRAQQKHKQRGAREAGRKDTGVPAGREFQRATVGKGPTVTPGWQGSPASRSLLLPAPPGMCQAVLTPANHP